MKWKNYFYQTILSRGEKYYQAGRVKRLNYKNGEWLAVVKGIRSYNVRIGLKSDGEIESLSCSCPYADGGQACKHMAAVFLRLKKNGRRGSNSCGLR